MGKRPRARSSSRSESRARYEDSASRPISPPPLKRQQSSVAPKDPFAQVEERFDIFSWNVNGVSQFLQEDTPKITSFFGSPSSSKPGAQEVDSNYRSPLRKFLERHAWPQVVCLQEVKISPQDSKTKTALEKAANNRDGNDAGPRYAAHYSLPRDKHNAKGLEGKGKVHGVCTLIHSSLLQSSGTREIDWDLEGRVLITDFPKWCLAIINGYWVNGTTNPYRCPESGEVIGTRHDRKREFHAQMLAEVKCHEAKGWYVVLIGDMNIAPSLIDGYPNLRLGSDHVWNRKDFNEKFLDRGAQNGTRGIDTFRHLHAGLRKYTYHGEPAERWGESCDRVDLGIVSRSLVEVVRGALVGAEIWESVEERGGSDHVPLSITLDVGKLGDKSDHISRRPVPNPYLIELRDYIRRHLQAKYVHETYMCYGADSIVGVYEMKVFEVKAKVKVAAGMKWISANDKEERKVFVDRMNELLTFPGLEERTEEQLFWDEKVEVPEHTVATESLKIMYGDEAIGTEN